MTDDLGNDGDKILTENTSLTWCRKQLIYNY